MHPASRIKGLEVAAPGSVVEGAGVELGGNVDIGDNVEFGGCDVCCAAVWLEDDTGVEHMTQARQRSQNCGSYKFSKDMLKYQYSSNTRQIQAVQKQSKIA
ncbi:hypothetical protein WJX75_001215 [Coccomyxa subellipsoidea]|uniref:Dynactin subunit 6 n=1 Tax=Coccomyxa subellipsoidea TaxID=248742 RepID=A0ABR2YDH4_9CHLO